MKADSLIELLMAGALLALASGCSSTHIQSARTPAGVGVAPFHNVMVIGVDERPEVRNPFENDVVALLRERGVDGTASYASLTFDEVKGDKEQLRRRLLAAKQQSVLFVRVTAQNDFMDGPPPTLGGEMDMQAVDEARYVEFTTGGGDINTMFRLGARLYRVSDGEVVWRAVLGEVLKQDADALAFIERTAKTIVEQMAKDKVIP